MSKQACISCVFSDIKGTFYKCTNAMILDSEFDMVKGRPIAVSCHKIRSRIAKRSDSRYKDCVFYEKIEL